MTCGPFAGIVSDDFQEPMTALNPVHTIGKQICEVLTQHNELDPDVAWNGPWRCSTKWVYRLRKYG